MFLKKEADTKCKIFFFFLLVIVPEMLLGSGLSSLSKDSESIFNSLDLLKAELIKSADCQYYVNLTLKENKFEKKKQYFIIFVLYLINLNHSIVFSMDINNQDMRVQHYELFLQEIEGIDDYWGPTFR